MMEFLGNVGGLLWQTLLATGTQFLVLLGPLLALAFILDQIATRLERTEASLFGGRNFIRYFAIIGVPIHELGHAFFCLVFRHRITEIRLFRPDPDTGTLGYVRHTYNVNSFYQQVGNFFIGIGPIFSGGLVIFAAMHLAAGHSLSEAVADATSGSGASDLLSLASTVLASALRRVAVLFDVSQVLSWKFWLLLYLVLAVGGNITLSRSDIEGASRGFFTLAALLFAFNLIAGLFGQVPTSFLFRLASLATPLYAALTAAALLNLCMTLLLKLALLVMRR